MRDSALDARNEAYCKERPFLRKYLLLDEFRFPPFNIHVSRINLTLLYERRETEPTQTGNTVVKRIFLLDEKGNEIYEVGGNFRWWNLFTWKNSHFRSETVGEALIRLGEKARGVRYIVLQERGFYDHPHRLELFKPPKDLAIPEWIKGVEDRMRGNVRQEIEKV